MFPRGPRGRFWAVFNIKLFNGGAGLLPRELRGPRIRFGAVSNIKLLKGRPGLLPRGPRGRFWAVSNIKLYKGGTGLLPREPRGPRTRFLAVSNIKLYKGGAGLLPRFPLCRFWAVCSVRLSNCIRNELVCSRGSPGVTGAGFGQILVTACPYSVERQIDAQPLPPC